MSNGKLTPEQIKHWRESLSNMIGAFAFVIPDEKIQAIRDKMQADADRKERERKANEKREAERKAGFTIGDIINENKNRK